MKPCLSIALLLAALFCLPPPLLAQGPAPAQTPQSPATAPPAAAPDDKAALIQQLLAVRNVRQNADASEQILMDEAQRLMAKFTPKEIATDPNLTPAQRTLLMKNGGPIEARALVHYRQLLAQRVDLGAAMVDITARLYDQYFTADDIHNLIAFYGTPTGRKLVSLEPQIAAEAARLKEAQLAPKLLTSYEQVLHQERLDWEQAVKPQRPHSRVSPLT